MIGFLHFLHCVLQQVYLFLTLLKVHVFKIEFGLMNSDCLVDLFRKLFQLRLKVHIFIFKFAYFGL